MTSVDTKPLKLGVIGIGVGAAEMLPPMERAPYIDLFAGADVNPDVRERFQARYETARVYDSAEALCKDPDVEAVWISTPNRFHGPMTVLAANHGKHVVVEKPMALEHPRRRRRWWRRATATASSSSPGTRRASCRTSA